MSPLKLTMLLTLLCSTLSFGQSTERIFYSSFTPQDWDIYISRDSGTNISKFTAHPSLDYDAVISPDGKWVVFTSERSGIPQLYLKAIDGTKPALPLLKSNSFQDQAVFSPDGRHLAFVGAHEGNSEIYLIPFVPELTQDISVAVNLTNHPGGDFRPAFSPDGKKLTFSSDRAHKIVPHPRFSFARQRTGDVFSMDINGEKLKRLTESESWDGSPIWSSDGAKIIFYSDRNGDYAIFEMNADGSNQHQLIEFKGPAVSPRRISGNRLAFTTWNSQQDFKIMQFDSATGEITPLISNAPDLMFHADIHPEGIMVFHGGKYATSPEKIGRFGFAGDVLAKIPDSISFADQQVNAYGVRRAFVAPPQQGNTLLFYDASDIQSFFDFLRPMGYSVFWLPLLIISLFLTGIVMGIRNRKMISFWKYLLFSMLTVLFGVGTGGFFLYIDAINPMPVPTIQLAMGLFTVLLVSLGWWQYRRFVRQREDNLDVYRLSRLYSSLFFGLALFTLLCTAFINYFVNSSLHFYQVDYLSGERSPLFTLEKEPDINPANFSVLDSKVTHDGSSLIITTGSFRGSPSTQGDIWKYDFDTRNVTRLSESPHNDGFADVSEDGKMVFRSGRSGYFDIYLKTEGMVHNLTEDVHRDNFPAISKQGDYIVFASDRLQSDADYKTMDIFMMKLKADNEWSEPERISVGAGQNAHPHFSPDGNWVIYTTEGFGINDEQPLIQPVIFSPQMYGEIVAYHVETKERHRLTHNKWEDGAPLWVK